MDARAGKELKIYEAGVESRGTNEARDICTGERKIEILSDGSLFADELMPDRQGTEQDVDEALVSANATRTTNAKLFPTIDVPNRNFDVYNSR